jgi:hypothetical protein
VPQDSLAEVTIIRKPQCLSKHKPCRAWFWIIRRRREQIVDALGEACAAKGLEQDDEPNAYGLEIEALTDTCGLAWDDHEKLSGERQR